MGGNVVEIIKFDDTKTIKELVTPEMNNLFANELALELKKDKYNFVVTLENLKEAKGICADLNKGKAFISEQKTIKVNEENTDIELFKTQFKTYFDAVDKKRTEILANVKVFEDKFRKGHQDELEIQLKKMYDDEGLPQDYRIENVISLVSLSGLTSKGALNKKSLDGLTAIFNQAKGEYAQAELKRVTEDAEKEAEIARRVEEQRIKDLKEAQEYTNKIKDSVPTEVPTPSLFEEPPAYIEQPAQPIPQKRKQPHPAGDMSDYHVNINYVIKNSPQGLPLEKIKAKVAKMMKEAGFESELSILVTEDA